MKIISFNINGLRARLPQLASLINAHQPDLIALQETKVKDSDFPLQAIEELGYHASFFGQPGHYGVAILSREKPLAVRHGLPSDDENAQKRLISATFTCKDGAPLTLINGYFPQGERRDHPEKFPAKEKFYRELRQLLDSAHSTTERLLVVGDLNVAPFDADIGIGEPNRKRWLREGKCAFLPEERQWLQELMAWGLTDSFREVEPDSLDRFSWFDYRSDGFSDNRGLRIDLILVSPPLVSCIDSAGIDYELRGHERPSDHAPIWVEFEDL